jgi:pimeloyl-ACP methyl ester carboxylesterase
VGVDEWLTPVTREVTVGDRVVSYCLYGPADGSPVIACGGSPGSRWRRPEVVRSAVAAGVRLLTFDRPGYPGSTRQPGRRIADVVTDVAALADAQGWDRVAVFGWSGGGPYALACAALLADRVTRCATGAGVAPPEAGIPGGEAFQLARHGEPALRPRMEQITGEIMAAVEAGGPELIPESGASAPATAPARDDPAALARLRATFLHSHDGWIDDLLAVTRPWGFDPTTITVPVGIWHAQHDTRISTAHADWLTAAIPTAERYDNDGGHVPDTHLQTEMLSWLTT